MLEIHIYLIGTCVYRTIQYSVSIKFTNWNISVKIITSCLSSHSVISAIVKFQWVIISCTLLTGESCHRYEFKLYWDTTSTCTNICVLGKKLLYINLLSHLYWVMMRWHYRWCAVCKICSITELWRVLFHETVIIWSGQYHWLSWVICPCVILDDKSVQIHSAWGT